MHDVPNPVCIPGLATTPADAATGGLRLRAYQSAAVNTALEVLAAGRNPLVVSPTGGGKSAMLASIASPLLEAGGKVTTVVHSEEMFDQMHDELQLFGITKLGSIKSGLRLDPNAPMQIAMVKTLAKLGAEIDPGHLLAVDEAHHSRTRACTTIARANSLVPIVGFTATPLRLDGAGLGRAAGGLFDEIVQTPGIRALQALDYLAGSVVFAPNAAGPDMRNVTQVRGDYLTSQTAPLMMSDGRLTEVVQNYVKHASGLSALAFCVDIRHAEALASAFMAAGIKAAPLHGRMSRAKRREAFADLKSGQLQVLTSCEVLGEGINVPTVGAVILARPTASLVVYLQQIGRGLRRALGKGRLVILDHAGNTHRFGMVNADRVWSLAGAKPSESIRGGIPPLKQCPSCDALLPTAMMTCSECNQSCRFTSFRASEISPRNLEKYIPRGAFGVGAFSNNMDQIRMLRQMPWSACMEQVANFGDLLLSSFSHGLRPEAAYDKADDLSFYTAEFPAWLTDESEASGQLRDWILEGWKKQAKKQDDPNLVAQFVAKHGF